MLIPTYTGHLLSHSPFTRMGYCLALGGLPRPLLVGGQLRVVLDSLMRSCSDSGPSEAKFAEARRDAICSITRYMYCIRMIKTITFINDVLSTDSCLQVIFEQTELSHLIT